MKQSIHMSDSQKKELVRRKHFAYRLNIFFFCTFVIFSVLVVRLAILQFVEGEELAKQESKSTYTVIPIAPIRGSIFDNDGKRIAYSTSTQSLYYRLDNTKKEEVIAKVKALSGVFQKYGDADGRLTPEDIIKEMDVGYDLNMKERKIVQFSYVPRKVKSGLTNREIAYLMEHKEQFSGFDIVEESVRNYDDSSIAVQLVGYLRPFNAAMNHNANYLNYYRDKNNTAEYLERESVGFDGLEFMYQKELRGKNGSKSYPINAAGKIVGEVTMTPPEKGNSLYLTIDREVQQVAEQAILDQLDYMKKAVGTKAYEGRNATTGYAVAMEVESGNVVAMASMPDYDPNIWRKGSISGEDYKKVSIFLNNGTIMFAPPALYDPEELKKHPYSLVYLGSTIKPLTILIGLNEKLFGMHETYLDRGKYEFGKNKAAKIANAGGKANGLIDAEEAIKFSSNTFMSAMVGQRLYDRPGLSEEEMLKLWDNYMAKFGLGVVTGSGLPNEDDGVIDYYHEAETASGLSAIIRASWGQMAKYTTMQLAQYAATLANEGKRLKPQFVKEIRTYDGKLVKKFEPEVLDETKIPAPYWDLVHKGMSQVAQSVFQGLPYRVAAKTGTSQQDVGGKVVENSVFIAFAPADNPKLAVAVIVPEGGYGALGAAPIARKIFEAYDKEFGLVQLGLETTGAAQ